MHDLELTSPDRTRHMRQMCCLTSDADYRAHAHGYIPYVTDRALGRLRINPGFEPDKDPSQRIYLTPTP